MSVKPGTLPRWANVGGSIVVPPAGVLDVGHLPNQAPLPVYENWYKNLVFQWCEYLSDGDIALANISCVNLTTTGNTLLGNAIGDTCAISGPLTATGLTTANGGLAVVGGINQTGGGSTGLSGTLNVTGLISATAGVTAAVNQNVTVSGTGKYVRGNRTRTVSALSGTNPTSGAPTTPSGNAIVFRTGASGGAYVIPIPVEVGERIGVINLNVRATAIGAIATMQLVRQVNTVVTTVGASWSSAGANTYADFPSANLAHDVVAGSAYQLQITFSGTVGNSDFERVDITTTIP